MTLRSWAKKFDGAINNHPSGAVWTFATVHTEARRALYNLTDYTVTSANGEVIWLKKNKKVRRSSS